uniref:Uncharacterized protein n=1 Tax=viral metagenome TaxID=1070528 RepID=A0A6M3IRN2_9ZZZZ
MKAFKQTDKYSISLGQDKKTITLNLRGCNEIELDFKRKQPEIVHMGRMKEGEEMSIQPIKRLEGEIFALRQLLWLHHGCPLSMLYGDIGEMQCNNTVDHKPIDFKRDSTDDIRVKFMLSEKQFMEAIKDLYGNK